LITVATIFFLVSGLALVGFQKWRVEHDVTACSNNLKELGAAVHKCVDITKRVPPAWNPDTIFSDQTKNQGLTAGTDIIGTWHFIILPFIDQQRLYDCAITGAGQSDYRAAGIAATILPQYLCPADRSNNDNITSYGFASTSYVANLWVFDPRGTGNIIQAMPDGSSNTIMVAEAFMRCPFADGISPRELAWANHPDRHYRPAKGWGGPSSAPVFGWVDFTKGNTFLPTAGMGRSSADTLGRFPNYSDPYFATAGDDPTPPGAVGFQIAPTSFDQPCNPNITQGGHRASVQVGLGDGSVRAVSSSVTTRTWVIACCPNDGRALASDICE
jgi:hypothetical protein